MLAKKNNKDYKSSVWLAAGAVGDVIIILALPVVFFTLAGKYLDTKFDKHFFYIVIGGILGITVGIMGVYKKAKELKEMFYGKNKGAGNDAEGNK